MSGRLEITHLGDFIETDNLYPYIIKDYVKKSIYHFLCSEQDNESKLISFLTKKIKFVMRKTYIENSRTEEILRHPKNKLTLQFSKKEYIEVEYENNFANVIFNKHITSIFKLFNKLEDIFKNHTNVERDLMYKSLFTSDVELLDSVTQFLTDNEYECFKENRSKLLNIHSLLEYKKPNMIILLDRNSEEYSPFSRESEYTNKELIEIRNSLKNENLKVFNSEVERILKNMLLNTENENDKDLIKIILFYLNTEDKIHIITNKDFSGNCLRTIKSVLTENAGNCDDYRCVKNISFIRKRDGKNE